MNFFFFKFKQNPYVLDQSFAYKNNSFTVYKTDIIQDQNNKPFNSTQTIDYKYSMKKTINTTKLICIGKEGEKWAKDGCKTEKINQLSK